MRCTKCSKQWKLSGADGPVGKAAPGHFMIVVGILASIALLLWLKFNSIGALAFAALVVLFFMMALVGCGYKAKDGDYQGSECPAGTRTASCRGISSLVPSDRGG